MSSTVSRLKRAQGRLTALIAAVGSGADCRNVVTQLSAARGALDKAGFELKSTLEEIHTLFPAPDLGQCRPLSRGPP
jgi:DNA-binding FrmR family transcriptional regulator